MDEQQKVEYEAEQKKEHIRYVAKSLPSMVRDVGDQLGGFKNFKIYEPELQQLQVLKKVTDRWVKGTYGESISRVVEAVAFDKRIPFQAAYDIYLAAEWAKYEKLIVDEDSPIPAKFQEKIC